MYINELWSCVDFHSWMIVHPRGKTQRIFFHLEEWVMNTGTLLIVAFVAAAVGYAAGLILTRRGMEQEEHDKIQNAEGGPRYEIHKLSVILWSKTPHGPMLADLYGKTLQSKDELIDADRNRLQQDIRTVEAYFGLQKPAVQAAAVESTPVEAPAAPVQPAVEVHQPAPAASQPAAVTPPPPAPIPPVPVMEEPPAPGSRKLEDLTPEQLKEVLPPPAVEPVQPRIDNLPKAKVEPAPKSIVGQINDILQDKVTASSLAGEGVKLQETPQGVLVWVGAKSFQGIDTVPEGEAKNLIRAAVKEWEKR